MKLTSDTSAFYYVRHLFLQSDKRIVSACYFDVNRTSNIILMLNDVHLSSENIQKL